MVQKEQLKREVMISLGEVETISALIINKMGGGGKSDILRTSREEVGYAA